MQYRVYDPERDKEATHRIWRETGWTSSDESEQAMDLFLSGAHVLVVDIDGEAECLAASSQGDMRYLDEVVSLSVVEAVTTSHVARRQGFAGRLTAQIAALDAADGAALSGLGVFEQGFYNRLGYGNGAYEHMVRFDPSTLKVGGLTRPPQRLTSEHAKAALAARLSRYRGHGACNVYSLESMQAEMSWNPHDFGLGFLEEDGETVSHFFWASGGGRHGPYRIEFMAYKTRAQFLELMAVIKSLGDQVHAVRMREPAHIQMQDLLETPFRQRSISDKSEFEAYNDAIAYWQMRICDLDACLAATHLRGEPVRFNLALADPIVDFLDDDAPWQGIGGEYVVTLGPESSAKTGTDVSLPTLRAGVGAFTRMWLGVRPASGLAVTDELAGPDDLLAALDAALCLPAPHPDWDF